MRDKISPAAEKQIAAKTIEAIGLAAMLKPLLKRAGSLTKTEQSVMINTVSKISYLFNDATSIVWEERTKEDTSKAVVKAG